MPQNITPQPSMKPHPDRSSPPGTTMLDPATCVAPDGAPPFIAYPIAGGGVRVRQVSAEIAAEHLAWWPTSPAPRLASDDEVAEYRAAELARIENPAGLVSP